MFWSFLGIRNCFPGGSERGGGIPQNGKSQIPGFERYLGFGEGESPKPCWESQKPRGKGVIPTFPRNSRIPEEFPAWEGSGMTPGENPGIFVFLGVKLGGIEAVVSHQPPLHWFFFSFEFPFFSFKFPFFSFKSRFLPVSSPCVFIFQYLNFFLISPFQVLVLFVLILFSLLFHQNAFILISNF